MPPKKKGAAKATAATPVKATRASAPIADPITTRRGREIEATAAATRPKRGTAASATPAEIPSRKMAATKKRAASSAQASEEPPKKRGPGRPPKNASAAAAKPAPAGKKRGRASKSAPVESDDEESAEELAPPKKRGRPSKAQENAEDADQSDDEEAVEEPATEPKKRGRPSKKTAPVQNADDDEEEEPAKDSAPEPKRRGRPPKKPAAIPEPKRRGRAPKNAAPTRAADADEDGEPDEETTSKKPGRETKVDVPAVPEDEKAPPKRRGQPPKGGETTRISGDDAAAAEQLEEELVDNAEEQAELATGDKGTASMSKKGKGKARNSIVENGERIDQNPSGKNYWLMKAEQEGHEVPIKAGGSFNTTFTIDMLKENCKTAPEPWDGVRNPSAAKNMREMKKGDLAFFYASGGKNPGIVGIMEIVKEHEPDQTAWDEKSYGYVEKEKDRSKWCVVHVEYRKKLKTPVYRSELQKHLGDGALGKMQEFNAARLSVSKVSEDEWNFIYGLITEFEDEADQVGDNAASAMGTKESEPPVDAQPSKETALSQPTPAIQEPASVTQSTETGELMTDGIADATSATSRPNSRAGSRQPSLKPSSRTGSRAGSLAPPAATSRAGSRAGSRAPSRAGSATPAAAPGRASKTQLSMPPVSEDDYRGSSA